MIVEVLGWLQSWFQRATPTDALTFFLVLITGWYALQTREQAKASRAAVEEMRRAREAQAEEIAASNRAVEEMRQARELQSRAYVTVELWPWDHGMGWFDLAIRNYGAAAARDITIVTDEDVPQPQYAGGTFNELEIFRGLPFLAPHDEVLFFFAGKWQLDSRRQGNDAPIPDVWHGTVRFTDDLGQQEQRFRINMLQFERLGPMLPGQGNGLRFPPIRRGWGTCRCGALERVDPRTA